MGSVVSFSGSKGGTGKTTAAHLCAHGAGSLSRPIATVLITTDPLDQLVTDERRYLVVDGRTPQLLADALARYADVERALVIVDGVANRPDIDEVVAKFADLAVLPYGPSRQEADRVATELGKLPGAVALPNRWPKHPGTASRVKRWLQAVSADRRLPPFPALPKLDGLLDETGYTGLAYEIASPSRGLALEILAALRVDPDDLAAPRQPELAV